MISSAVRELLLVQIYEHALSSAFAHGKALTDFSFSLPQPDDVLARPDGSRAYREDADESGYTAEELALYQALTQPTSFSLPASFLNDEETVREAHLHDLEEIAHGVIRDAYNLNNTQLLASLPYTFSHFAHASIAFHEQLLRAVETLHVLDRPEHAALLLRTHFPELIEASERLTFAVRRLDHSLLTAAIEQGVTSQLAHFLSCGSALGNEKDFFEAQLRECSLA